MIRPDGIDLNARSAWDFDLPPELVAAVPADDRTASRLLVVDPAQNSLTDATFATIGDWLRPGDLLVVNDTRVTPARFVLSRSGGAVLEVLVVGFGAEGRWDDPAADLVAMVRGSGRLGAGELLVAGDGTPVRFVGREDDGLVRLDLGDPDANAFLARAGQLPLPPYIVKRRRELGAVTYGAADDVRYQTVYARDAGSVAAPTAGLHFDAALLQSLGERGVGLERVTLQVGIGTFQPVRAASLDEHTMHGERWTIGREAAERINTTRAAGGRVVAVGTTVVRTLESASQRGGIVVAGSGETALFIRPGYSFGVVDALVTNFHLPGSTLLALVAAFAGYDRTFAAYAHAIAMRYRFFSYGDAMFITGHT